MDCSKKIAGLNKVIAAGITFALVGLVAACGGGGGGGSTGGEGTNPPTTDLNGTWDAGPMVMTENIDGCTYYEYGYGVIEVGDSVEGAVFKIIQNGSDFTMQNLLNGLVANGTLSGSSVTASWETDNPDGSYWKQVFNGTFNGEIGTDGRMTGMVFDYERHADGSVCSWVWSVDLERISTSRPETRSGDGAPDRLVIKNTWSDEPVLVHAVQPGDRVADDTLLSALAPGETGYYSLPPDDWTVLITDASDSSVFRSFAVSSREQFPEDEPETPTLFGTR